ncbi:MAG: hypothetical protein HKO54_04165 [Flavobacteriaceae bacterium]|nr:hypothetical protein [Flavobacteriaceae bacterium]
MDDFYYLAQITTTIAGFAALFSILKHSNKTWNDLAKVNLIRFYIMIELACIITIFCFVPIVLSEYFEQEVTFRVSFGSHFLFSTIYYVFALKRNKRITGLVNIAGTSTKIVRIFSIGVLIFAVFGALNFLGDHYKTNYLISLILVFLINLYMFLRLIYFSMSRE